MPTKTGLSVVEILFGTHIKNYMIFCSNTIAEKLRDFVGIVLNLCDLLELKVAIYCSVKPIRF